MPFDGDPRASYLLVSDGAAEVRRVEYDVERAVADVRSSGMPMAGMLEKAYRSGNL